MRGATLETCLTKILCLSSETTICTCTIVVRSTGTTVVLYHCGLVHCGSTVVRFGETTSIVNQDHCGSVSEVVRIRKLCISCVVLAGSIQVVGMSATLSNISDLASFLKADTFSSHFRPVSYYYSNAQRLRVTCHQLMCT